MAVRGAYRWIPNALTIARFALVPVFVVLMVDAEDGHSWAAGILFGIAAVTDQVDGWLARRWHVESEFGKYADPLADRLMIDAAVMPGDVMNAANRNTSSCTSLRPPAHEPTTSSTCAHCVAVRPPGFVPV